MIGWKAKVEEYVRRSLTEMGGGKAIDVKVRPDRTGGLTDVINRVGSDLPERQEFFTSSPYRNPSLVRSRQAPKTLEAHKHNIV